ncbi:MAG: redox-regulated ATPase YchF [Candidatus Parcubacteria bacterium]|nr:redox-regulated ATPase YchF [Candidatus Parcubacteria bacterium]
MSLSIGIVGLPNVGKSTIFNALTRQKVDAANYPFCTINPNVGCVKVPDQRLDKLAEMSKSEKIIHSTIEFIDIAGLVRGAHKGEGLGNKFLTNIRECNAICHILRHFVNENITHVENRISAKDDLEIINMELMMADLDQVNAKLKAIKSDNAYKELFQLLERIKTALDNSTLIKDLELTPEELILIREYNFLSAKPCMYVFNIAENDLNKTKEQILTEAGLKLDQDKVILVCGKMEEELTQLSEQEALDYLKNFNVEQTGLQKMIIAGYKLVNYISMLTTGPKETRSWQIINGFKAPQAAGKIHTDFEKGFARVEVIYWNDLLMVGGWNQAKEKGLVRMEGKDYIVKDGDVVVFHFST